MPQLAVRRARATMRITPAPLLALLVAAVGCADGSSLPTSSEEPAVQAAAPAVATASAPLVFAHVSVSTTHACGLSTTGRAYCWGGIYYSDATVDPTRPNPVAGDLRFLEIRAGATFTCGLATDNRVYCWGWNQNGELGTGSPALYDFVPTPIAGSRRYRAVRTGESHACAITLANVTFCWGLNAYGQLGDGTITTRRSPVRVVGTVAFLQVSPGLFHTCALSTSDKAYCWGQNTYGQLGNRSSTSRSTPGAVADGRTFRALSAGQAHSCAVTPENQAYCWGRNNSGQLGDGTTSRRSRPTLVAGGLAFTGVDAGAWHTCGVTTGKRAYCWGWNYYGQLGDGTEGWAATKRVPTAVAGNLSIDRVVTPLAAAYSCGVTTAGLGYCWGESGNLGNGDPIDPFTTESTPSPIAPPL